MIPLARLEERLKHLPKEKVEVILEIRNIVAGLCPDAIERLDLHGIVYYDAKRGGSVKGGICMFHFDADHLRLDFPLGAFLPDPNHLLSGSNLAKWGMNLADYEAVPWEQVEALIRASNAFDPASLTEARIEEARKRQNHA